MQERKKSMELSELSSMIAVSQKSSTHFSQESLRGCDIYFTRDCENFYTDKNLQEKNRWNYQFGSFTPLGHIYINWNIYPKWSIPCDTCKISYIYILGYTSQLVYFLYPNWDITLRHCYKSRFHDYDCDFHNLNASFFGKIN